MDTAIRIMVSEGQATRLGRLVLAGEVVDAEPAKTEALRVIEAYVLSVVTDGSGTYRHADGRVQPIRPGSVTVVLPGQPHWYGTAPGGTWTELFAVFTGPLFDTLAEVGVLAGGGPRQPRPLPAKATLRAALVSAPRSSPAAEHQLLALADWLLDAAPPAGGDPVSPPVTAAADLLAADLTAVEDLRTVAATVGLSYDALRRRFATEMGQPPVAFRNARRLQTAATLLRLTDMTIREIARTLGYVDEFHLSRRFRAHFGVPPRAYRSG